ncbi:MAG TPA: hypothetical protein VMF06_15790 [Candidatus Limnocylindria bacterium]|jgi:hypothetical protein|nr:hypothetical protein [Candidatus Limnocylindria bacterium]
MELEQGDSQAAKLALINFSKRLKEGEAVRLEALRVQQARNNAVGAKKQISPVSTANSGKRSIFRVERRSITNGNLNAAHVDFLRDKNSMVMESVGCFKSSGAQGRKKEILEALDKSLARLQIRESRVLSSKLGQVEIRVVFTLLYIDGKMKNIIVHHGNLKRNSPFQWYRRLPGSYGSNQ